MDITIEKSIIKNQGLELDAVFSDADKEFFELNNFLIFDKELALQFVGNDEGILSSILQEFIDTILPCDVQQMEVAYAFRDWDMLEKMAHKIKGGVEYCGAVRLKFACQYFEQYYKSGYVEHLEGLYKQLMSVKDETIIEMANWLSKY